jgi:hypothetical protein
MATLSPRDHLALRPARALLARISLGLRPWLLQFATRSKQPLLLDLLRQRGEQRSSILPHHSNEGSIVHHGRIAAPMTGWGQKHELPRRSIAVRFNLNEQTPDRRGFYDYV